MKKRRVLRLSTKAVRIRCLKRFAIVVFRQVDDCDLHDEIIAKSSGDERTFSMWNLPVVSASCLNQEITNFYIFFLFYNVYTVSIITTFHIIPERTWARTSYSETLVRQQRAHCSRSTYCEPVYKLDWNVYRMIWCEFRNWIVFVNWFSSKLINFYCYLE